MREDVRHVRMGAQSHLGRNVRNVPAQCQVTQPLDLPRSERPTGTSLFHLLAKYSRRGLLFDRQTADTTEHQRNTGTARSREVARLTPSPARGCQGASPS